MRRVDDEWLIQIPAVRCGFINCVLYKISILSGFKGSL
jgi:hypothetical protein